MSRKQAFTGIMLAALLVSLVVTAAAPPRPRTGGCASSPASAFWRTWRGTLPGTPPTWPR